MSEFKFNLGDIVIHVTGRRKMLVVARAMVEQFAGVEEMYWCQCEEVPGISRITIEVHSLKKAE